MNAFDHYAWQDRVRAGFEAPTVYFEELRERYNERAMFCVVTGLSQMFVTFDKCCYDAIMGDPYAKQLLHELAGGLQ